MKLLDDLVETQLSLDSEFSHPPYFIEKAVDFSDRCDLSECPDCRALLFFTSDLRGDILQLWLKTPQEMGPSLTHYLIDVTRHSNYLRLAQTWFGVSIQQLLDIINQAQHM